MKRLIVCLSLLAVGLVSAQDQPVQFKGWVFFEEQAPSPHYQFIDNEKALDEFRKRIPRKRPTKKQPAPPNEDPLLQEGAVDFSKHLLVVVSRGETISAYPEFLRTEEDPNVIIVKFRIPEPPPEARPYGWGTYRAITLPLTEKSYQVKYE